MQLWRHNEQRQYKANRQRPRRERRQFRTSCNYPSAPRGCTGSQGPAPLLSSQQHCTVSKTKRQGGNNDLHHTCAPHPNNGCVPNTQYTHGCSLRVRLSKPIDQLLLVRAGSHLATARHARTTSPSPTPTSTPRVHRRMKMCVSDSSVCVCVCACVRACVRACVCVCVCANMCVSRRVHIIRHLQLQVLRCYLQRTQ